MAVDSNMVVDDMEEVTINNTSLVMSLTVILSKRRGNMST